MSAGIVAHGPASASPWAWQPHPEIWLGIVGLAVAYLMSLRILGPRLVPDEVVATSKQKTLFLLGVGVLWLGADWPLHRLSDDFLFSAHMVQHTLFTLVAPPLLLAGMPAWLLRTLLSRPVVMKLARFATRPLVALVVFNAVIVVTHWPVVVDWSVGFEPGHALVHGVLIGSALLMWWPVIAPLPELPSLSDPAKGLYLFLQSIVPTVPASFLTFSSGVLYEAYASAPRIWGLSVVNDQRTAGLIMKIGGGLLLWSVITVIFFRWHAREEALSHSEAISWSEFERELEAWDLRR